jgi:hypothetical protein
VKPRLRETGKKFGLFFVLSKNTSVGILFDILHNAIHRLDNGNSEDAHRSSDNQH